MNRALQKAKEYCDRLDEGTLLGAPGSLEEVFTFLKRFRVNFLIERRSANADLNLVRTYTQLTTKLHSAICAELFEPLSNHFTPIIAGRGNIYAGIFQANGGRWFFKLMHISRAKEYKFLNALLEKKIPAFGDNYAFQLPRAIIELPSARAYVFPEIEMMENPSFDLTECPEQVEKNIWALAESNTSAGTFSYSSCPDFLEMQNLYLPDRYLEKVMAVFLARTTDESKKDIYAKSDRIQKSWHWVTEFAKNSTWGLAHGDPAPANSTLLGDRILFFDMGHACFSPLGSDLYWLLFKNRKARENQEKIISEYQKALLRYGVEMSYQDIMINAYSRYCRKWLILGKVGTNANICHFMECQAKALALIDETIPQLQR